MRSPRNSSASARSKFKNPAAKTRVALLAIAHSGINAMSSDSPTKQLDQIIGDREPPVDPRPVELAFSASAGAFVYQMGVAAYHQDHFDLSDCKFSGCSGGSWAAALLTVGTDVQAAWDALVQAKHAIIPPNASWNTGYGRCASVLLMIMQILWGKDPDVHVRVQQKHLSIAVTRFPSLQPERHTSWTSPDDLMKSILASATIPFAFSGKLCQTVRGKRYVDGGITNFKGINCDAYSTWADVEYHSKQLAIRAVRSVATGTTRSLSPPLTKPVAQAIDQLMPQLQSPHAAIAPECSSSRRVCPTEASLPTTD